MITSKQVTASHIVGGEITYTRTSAGVYTVTLTMYRDCSGIGFPSTVSVLGSDPVTDSVFTATSFFPGFAFDDPIILSPDTTFNVPPTVNADCVTGIPNFCVEKRIYTGTWTFTGAAPNGIVFEYETCCRNSTISNITSPGSASMTYRTTVFPAGVTAVNSTPEFTVDPPTVVAAGLPTTVNFSAVDADGDSLFYEWADALDQNATVVNYSSGYSGTNPLPSSPAATVNGADGTISANLNLQGQFVISVFITEFRNGVPLSRIQRDYQFNIASFSVMDLVVANAYQPVTCTDSLGDVGVTVNFGTPPYVYSWSTGATTPVVNNLPPGTYTVDVEDALGCEDSLSIQIIEAADLQSSMTYTDATCDVIGDATANASVLNSAGGPYTFTLNSIASPSGSWTNLDTGQYNMVIQDTNGYCIVDSTFSIVATNSWNTAVLDTVIDLDCWDGTTGQIQISGTNSTHNYTWTDGTTGASRTNMGPGDYSLYVLDPNSGCSDSIHAQVQAPDTLENDPYVVTDATCLAGTDGSFTTFVQGGTPPMVYTINGATYPQMVVVSTVNGDSVTVPNLSVGTYQFTAIDANGCDIKDSITIDAPATWYNFTLRGTGDLTCYDDSSGVIVFDSTGTINAITTWDDGFTQLNRDKLNAGNHTLYITHPAGCSDTMSFMLSQPPELLTAPVITTASCGPIADGSIVANASGGRTPYSYDLSGTASTNDSLGNLNSGTYLLTVSDSAGLCSVDTSLIVPHDTVWHDYTVTDLDSISCYQTDDGEITVSGTTLGIGFLWNDGSTDTVRTGLGAGIHNLYLGNSAGCRDTLSTTFSEPADLVASWATAQASCLEVNDGTITFSGTGGTGTINYFVDSAAVTGGLQDSLFTGTYGLYMIDANGCVEDSVMTVLADTNWHNITIDSTAGPTCSYTNDAYIELAGNTSAVTIRWSDLGSGGTRNNLAPGPYSAYITNGAGCADTLSASFATPDSLYIDPITSTPTACITAADGTVSFTAVGGEGTIAMLFNGVATTVDSISGLSAGMQTIQITDSLGCSVVDSIVVTADTVWQDYNITALDSISCYQADDGEITVSGTTTGLTFLWNDGSTDTNRTGLAPAAYELVIGNGAGCRDTLAAVLNEPSDLVASWATTQASCLEVNDGTITFSGTGGTGTINYFVDSAAVTGGLQDSLFAGSYNLYMMDANGCVEDSVLTVLADTNWHNITVDTINPISCSYLSDAYIGLAGNPAGLTIRWSDLGSGMARNNLAPGPYSAYITNGAGCADTLSRFFRTPDTLYIDPLVATPASCLSATDGTIVFTGVGGEGAIVNIFNGAFVPSDSISGLATGNYTVEVKDTLGCSVVENIVVPADTLWHDYSITAIDSISCYQADDGEITVSGTTTGLTFLWNDGSTDTNRTGLAPAAYELVIGNGAGCRDTLAAVLNEPVDLVASWATTPASCVEIGDGTITFNGTGGTGTINYFVDSAAVTGGLQDSLFTGTYGLYMIDANGCVEDSVMTVLADTNWHNITIDSTAGPTCSYTNDAYIELAGNTSAVTIRWSDLGSGGTRNNLAPGPYSAYITNGAGCADTLSASFATPDSLYIDPITSTPTACITAADGTVSFTAVGGEGTIAMLFNGVATTVDSISGLSAGMQTIQITDSLGCSVVDSIVVTADTVWQDYNITALDSISCYQADDGEITVSGTTTGLTFLWNDGSTDTNRTGLAPAAYELVIGNGAGCRDTLAAVLNEPSDLVASWATTQASCLEVNDGTITFSGTGGTGTINYFVDSAAVTGGLQDSLFTGTYGLYMIDANGCVEDSVMTVLADTNWHNITVDTINPISCSYLSDAYIGLAGNPAGLTIRWSDLGSGMARNNLAPGPYSAYITNGAGCADTLSRFFRTPDTLYIDPLVATPASCLSATDGTIVFTGVGGEGAIVNIFNGAFVPSDSISGLATGNYTVEVKDTLGCSVVENIVVPADTLWHDYSITAIDSISCYQADDGEITVSGTTTGLTFLWNDGSTDTNRTGLAPAAYELVIGNGAGCRDTLAAVLNEPVDLVASWATTPASCVEIGDGTITFNGTGGTGTLQYAMDSVAVSAGLQGGLSTDVYYLSIQDANGCVVDTSITVGADTNWSNITVASLASPTCFGDTNGAITMAGDTTGLQFLWNDGIQALNRSNIGAGNYVLTVSNAGGCADSIAATLAQNGQLEFVNAVITDASCDLVNDGSINIGAVGGSAPYSYNIGGTPVANGQFNGLASGTYVVTAVDSSGVCTIDTTVNIGFDSTWNALAVGTTAPPTCSYSTDASIDVVGLSTGLNYVWSDGDTTLDRNNIGAGNYALYVSTTAGCRDTLNVAIAQPDSLFFNSVVSAPASCLQVADASLSFAFTGGSGPISLSLNSASVSTSTFSNLSSGAYTVSAVDSIGCQIDSTLQIGADTTWNNISIAGQSNPTCFGDTNGTVTLGGNQAGLTFLWSDGSSSPNRTDLGAGTHALTVSNAAGCADTLNTTLVQNAPLLFGSISLADASCSAISDGSINATLNGGAGPYQYDIGGAPNNVGQFTGLSSGTYVVTAFDSTGICTVDTTLSIGFDSTWNALALASTTPLTCSNTNDASITISGAATGLNYVWNDGQTALNRTNLASGTYALYVSNAAGCQDTIAAVITQPDSLFFGSIFASDASCLQVNDASLSFSFNGGEGPLAVSLNGASTTTFAYNNLAPGTYSIVATDSLGCQIDTAMTIGANINWNNIAIASQVDPTCYGDTNGSITLAGDPSGLSFTWNDGVSALNRSSIGAGNYALTVTNAAGCADTITTVLVQNNELLFGFLTLTDASCNAISDGSIAVSANGGSAPYLYDIGGSGIASGSFTGLTFGSYTLTVTDSTGVCSIDTALSIGFDSTWNALALASTTPLTCSNTNDAAIDISGSIAGLNYVWSDGDTSLDRANIGSGTYDLYISNAAGCQDTLSTTIDQPDSLYFGSVVGTPASCLQVNDAALAFTLNGGEGPLSVTLNGATVSTYSLSNMSPGAYSIVAVDSLGCQIDSSLVLAADTNWNTVSLDSLFNPVCYGDTNGAIILSGGSSALSYLWNDGDSSLSRTAVGAGNYQLTITNAAGCLATESATLTQSPELLVGSVTSTDATCLSGSDGTIVVTGAGGYSPYRYVVQSDTNTLGSFNTLVQGTYTVSVLDSAGTCSVDTTITVGYGTDWYNITGGTVDDARCAGTNTGAITINTMGGATINQPFQWVDDAGAPLSRTSLYPGNYQLVIDNGQGCVDTLSYTVGDIDSIQVQYTLAEENCFGDSLGSISLVTSGGMPPYLHSWPSTGSMGPILLNAYAGTYYPTIIDDNGCIWSDSIRLGGPEELIVALSSSPPTSCGSRDGIIDLDIQGGTYPFVINLNGLQIPTFFNRAGPGVQVVTLVDANGCTWSDTVYNMAPRQQQVVFFPNAFTPTGDGINDFYEVRGDPECFTNTELIITDRWGLVYFRTDEPFQDFWDGSIPLDPSAQPQGQFQYRFYSSEYVETGTLIMIK